MDWSPEQIAHRLPLDCPEDETMRISHEAIYQALFIQGRGALRHELVACLRSGRALRVPQARRTGKGRAFVSEEIMISQRPAVVADRAVPGHWEGDLISGSGNTHMATLFERASRFVMLVKVEGKDTTSVVGALKRHIQSLPEGLMRSLTWDRGTEMAQH